jgi:uncharacterized protein YaiE (UPF0345 family)
MTEPNPTYTNVTLDPRANVYFDGACVSHTFHLADGTRKTAGVILPATLNFGTDAPEIMELHSGACRIRLAGSEDWTSYRGGDTFPVPGNSSFDIVVTETVSYICHYG